jgi:hypothetical protein
MNRVLVPKPQVPERISKRSAVEKAETHLRRGLHRSLRGIEALAKGILLTEPSRTKANTELIVRNTETGEERVLGTNLTVYQTSPSLTALQYLADRAMGKTPTRLEVTGEGGGGIAVVPWLPSFADVDEQNMIEGEVISET